MESLQYLIVVYLLNVSVIMKVLNLVINGQPSIRNILHGTILRSVVLNLVINGQPSIQVYHSSYKVSYLRFKPCYKWIAFNTKTQKIKLLGLLCFKPCYKWIAFNTKGLKDMIFSASSFKPCYKWIAFNTYEIVKK